MMENGAEAVTDEIAALWSLDTDHRQHNSWAEVCPNPAAVFIHDGGRTFLVTVEDWLEGHNVRR